MDHAPARPSLTLAGAYAAIESLRAEQAAQQAELAEVKSRLAALEPQPSAADHALLRLIARLVDPDDPDEPEVFGAAEIIDRATLAPSLWAELTDLLPGDPGTLAQRLGQALAPIAERGGDGPYRLLRLPAAGHAAQYVLLVEEA